MLRLFVVSLVVVATSAIALAQPGLVAPIPEEPSSYLGGGVVVGGVHTDSGSGASGLYGAFELEGGIRLSAIGSKFWARAVLLKGGMGVLDCCTTANDYLEARVGLEGPMCSAHSLACFVIGVDVGVRHALLMAGDGSVADSVNLDATTAVIVPRLGFDIGSTHFRVRPSAEVAFASDGGYGVALSLSSAYRW